MSETNSGKPCKVYKVDCSCVRGDNSIKNMLYKLLLEKTGSQVYQTLIYHCIQMDNLIQNRSKIEAKYTQYNVKI